MLQNLKEEISDCHRRAQECRQLAETALDEAERANLLIVERRFQSLARCYEITEWLAE
jgi:transcription elongation GreA/GreB family factor